MNADNDIQENIHQPMNTSRKLTRPVFFKKIFLEERETYLNVLYTQEEINDAFLDKDVIAKRRESERISKVASLIYHNHIKANNPEGRADAFASLYEQSLGI